MCFSSVPMTTAQQCLSPQCSAHSPAVLPKWKSALTLSSPCISSRQVPKVPTCSSTTCPRSLETRTYCRCSCLSETWSLPKSSSTNRQTLASASVRQASGKHVQMPAVTCRFRSVVFSQFRVHVIFLDWCESPGNNYPTVNWWHESCPSDFVRLC